MNKGFLILFFICFSFVALQNKNKYNVKIEDANEDQDKDIGLNHIRLGLFKKFIVKVINLDTSLSSYQRGTVIQTKITRNALIASCNTIKIF